MDIVGDFDTLLSVNQTPGDDWGHHNLSSDLVIIDPSAVSSIPLSGTDIPFLSVDTCVRQTSRGRGHVVGVCCSNDAIMVATSRGFIIRYFVDEGGNERVTEVEVAKGADSRVVSMFLDPSASHLMVCVKVGGQLDTHYIHRRWSKSKPIAKLKGVHVTAVAWMRPRAGLDEDDLDSPRGGAASSTASAAGHPSDSCTGPMLIGTDTGLLFQLSIDERIHGKKEPSLKQLFDFKDRRKAICSVYQEYVGEQCVVFLATPLYLYFFKGGTSLEAVFASIPRGLPSGGVRPVLEAVVPSQHSRLHLYYGDSILSSVAPSRFAWLVGSMVYHGDLALEGNEDAGPLRNVASLPLTDPSTSVGERVDGSGEEPRSLGMTQYHFILLSGDRLQAVNRVSGRVVAEVGFRSPAVMKNVSGEPSRSIDGLVLDEVSQSMFVYSDESMYEVVVRHEARDMWKVYLELQQWEEALRQCSSTTQRDQVHCRHADAALAMKDYKTAALHYAKIISSTPAFEDIALKLVEAEAVEALQLFLVTKLSVLGKTDRAQATMAAAWLTELYLDQINKELLEAGGQPSARYQASEEQLRNFLTDFVAVLDVDTTSTLLATYGRMDELLAFASARGDHEAVLEHLMQRPNGASRALAVLRKPSCSTELIYKFAPCLVAAATEEVVDFFIATKPPLDPRRLIPALLRFGEPGSAKDSRGHVLRYVEFAIDVLGSTDRSVHNLAVALHTMDPAGEAGLLAYLSRARDSSIVTSYGAGGSPLYDHKYALRLALEQGKHRACVKLLCELGMYEDAVQLALKVDLQLAKSVANQPEEEDEALRRKLWLAIARHVVQQGDGGDQAACIKQAVEFLKVADGLLKIEDVLPFFPDFVTIDNFKDAICDSLERYNRQIDQLKMEMEEATEIAEAVRRDLKLLSTQTATLSLSQPCARCWRPLADQPPPCGLPSGGAIQQVFLFPTGNAYHGLCCAAEVCELSTEQQRLRITSIMKRLSRAVGPNQGGMSDEVVQSLQSQFATEAASEDPRNGEVTVQMVDMPFIWPADKEQVDSWVV